MRQSEFWQLVDEIFGVRGQSLANDYVLTQFEGHSAVEALLAGFEPREVWFALCDAADVPESLRWGKPVQPKKH